MDLATFQPLLDWLTTHPGWTGVAVFLISFSESLLIVGLFVPGVVMMFGIGTLVAMGVMELWATLAWAAAGAVAGDGVSYWLGHHYKDRLRDMWPIRRYPALMARGEQFFHQHGGKSVLFGRFVGPVRPIIPTVAGMLGMTPARFLAVNVLSAIAWAPAYTLPGVVFGASMGVASEIATRLTVMVLATLVLLWLTVWLVYRLYALLQPRTSAIIDRLLNWGRGHRYARNVISSVLDPQESEVLGLAIIGAALVSIALLLVTVGHQLFNTRLTLANQALFQLLQGLRVPWIDKLAVLATTLSSITVLLTIAVVTCVWLAWKKIWMAMIHCLAAAAFAVILTITLDWSRMAPLSSIGATWASGPVVMSTILYGLLAVMITQGMHGVRRWIPYAIAGVVIVAINLSQLYLGAVWLSQVVAGVLLSLLWLIIFGTAFRLHATVPVAPRGLTVVVLLTLLGAMTLQVGVRYDRDLLRYAPQHTITALSAANWWDGQWQTLPAYRIDLEGRGNHPLTVQLSGSPEKLVSHLKSQGWHEPPRLEGSGILQWLRPAPTLNELPILPQAHDGRYDILRLVHAGPDAQQLVVLRLWTSNYKLSNPERALWVGTVTLVHASTPMPWLTIPITGRNFDTPLQTLQTAVSEIDTMVVQRHKTSDMPWNGKVLLIRAEN